MAAGVLQEANLNVNERLERIDKLIPLPATATAEQLGQLIGKTKQAVLKTPWWKLNRQGEKADEIGRRQLRHEERTKTVDGNVPDEDEG